MCDSVDGRIHRLQRPPHSAVAHQCAIASMDEFIASKLVFIRDKLKRCLLWKLAHVAVQPSFSQETQYLIDGYSAVYSICEHLVAEFGKSLYLLQFAERKVRDEIRQLRFSLISFPVFH